MTILMVVALLITSVCVCVCHNNCKPFLAFDIAALMCAQYPGNALASA